MGDPEAKAERYQKALVALVSDIQRTELTPLFKEGYLCAARCCDTHSPEGMQACIDRCQTSADGARAFLDTAINEFHGRMQRCLVRCQDKAKDSMPASPSERDMRTAQGKLAGCFADCAEEYERQLPKLGKDIRSQLRQALNR